MAAAIVAQKEEHEATNETKRAATPAAALAATKCAATLATALAAKEEEHAAKFIYANETKHATQATLDAVLRYIAVIRHHTRSCPPQ